MVVQQRPRAREFTSTMQDYIIDTTTRITFSVEFAGATILDEEYVPDANNQVHIRRLGKFCEMSLHGVWDNTLWHQAHAAGVFTFKINGAKDCESFVMISRFQPRVPADNFHGVLTDRLRRVTRRGQREYVSGFLLQDPVKGFVVRIKAMCSGTELTNDLFVEAAKADDIYTIDVSVATLELRVFQGEVISSYTVQFRDESVTFVVDENNYARKDRTCFRYFNQYDMPETVLCVGEMKLAGSNKNDLAIIGSVERKCKVEVTDEYTIHSGPFYLVNDYRAFHDMMGAQDVQIRVGGEWLPIIITKHKFERTYRNDSFKEVEFTFRMADPVHNNMIEL